MSKRLILLLDGTWDDADIGLCDTNIVRMRDLIANNLWTGKHHNHRQSSEHSKMVSGYAFGGIEHIVFYERGVGTGAFDRFKGGVFGEGLGGNIRRAYKFLSFWYDPGDEVFIFGFSRGAFTARSLVGYIAAAGVLRRKCCTPDVEAEAWGYYRTAPDDRLPGVWERLASFVHDRDSFRIALVGVFETVGSLGIPLSVAWRENREKYQFHNVDLSSITDVNLHALAIDEHREPFQAAVWRKPPFKDYRSTTEQVWFAGAHCDVGGSYIVEETRASQDRYSLDDISIAWMLGRTKHFHPDFPCDVERWRNLNSTWSSATQHEARRLIYRALPFALRSIANVHTEADKWAYEKEVSRDRHAQPIGEMVHISALERLGQRVLVGQTPRRYKPKNLISIAPVIARTYGIAAESTAGPDIPVVGWSGSVLKPPTDAHPCPTVHALLTTAEGRLGVELYPRRSPDRTVANGPPSLHDRQRF